MTTPTEALAAALLRAVPGYQRWLTHPANTANAAAGQVATMESEAHVHAFTLLSALSSSGWSLVRTEGLAETREALESMALQFGYWSDGVGGIGTGGLSALEEAFDVLGWDDPHPLPERRCDEPGCMQDGTMGWPTRPGGTGPNGGYRRTCWGHSDIGKARAAESRP
ncbi:MAG TPA: hypothetical protein VI341_13835 [Actinomycetota bacterium]